MRMTRYPTLNPALAACLATVLLSGCAEIPEIDDLTDGRAEHADYPPLVPIEQILGAAPSDPRTDQKTADQLSARAAGLQARANRLKRESGIDDATRERLDDGVETN